jgi:60 kDa SS-A/Ro ribonucleoprotein
MMTKIYNIFNRKTTPQSLAIPGAGQVPNSAGGYAWALDDWGRLDRFLVLGSEGGTYYIGERALTIENAEAVQRCIKADGLRTVKRIVEISEAGRAPKNDPALFALALAAAFGEQHVRKAALESLPCVARTGTHLFHFMQYVDGMRGWGRGLRSAVAAWYADKSAEDLVYQSIKYRQRDGWTHRDALRLAHPVARTPVENDVYHWITQGWPEIGDEPHPDPVLRVIWAFEKLQAAGSESEVIKLLEEYRLPWETVPSQWLASANVWEALLPHLPMTATLRNLGRMSANGMLVDRSHAANAIVERLASADALKAARVHPLSVLTAMKTYEQGHGERGSLSWKPVRKVVDALDKAFYLSFGNVEPMGKRIMLALDVSGSMVGSRIAGMNITAREGAAAMALVTANVEADYVVTIFSSAGTNFYTNGIKRYRSQDGMSTFDISPRQRLDDVIRKTSNLPFGGTDCALPMLYALHSQMDIDMFIIYTDSETWAGGIHPSQALKQYRQQTGIPVRMVVVGMTSNGFTIADPNDPGMMDVVGFDPATSQAISEFSKLG